jgi:hypothetical protein
MRIMFTGYDVLSYALDKDERCDEAKDKEYARVDHHLEEVAIVLWNMGFGVGIVRLAHTG